MRRNPGNHLRDIRIFPYAKWWIQILSDIPEVIARMFQKIRMWNAEKSGQLPLGNPNLSGREMRKNPVEFVNPDFFGYSWGDCPDFSKKSGCDVRRYPGNYLLDVRIYPDAKWRKILFCLLACCCLLNKVFGDFRMSKTGFIRMREAKKSGQSPQGRRNLSGCEIRICPDAIDKK